MSDNTEDKKKWDFRDQLVVGSRGEELFLQHYHSPLVIYPEHRADFKRVSDGALVELKSDTYNIDKTPYFFMERWSDFHQKKPGGPWQSREKRVDVFCYLFVRHNIYYEFNDLKVLTKELDKLTDKQGMVFVKNKGWVTAGFKVLREALKGLYTRYEFKNEVNKK
jgi:hypothetical protein